MSSFLSSQFHGRHHSRRQGGSSGGLGRQSDERAHGSDLMSVLLHAPVEGAAVFRANQSLRGTHALGQGRHVKGGVVFFILEGVTALFFFTKTGKPFNGVKSGNFQIPAVLKGKKGV